MTSDVSKDLDSELPEQLQKPEFNFIKLRKAPTQDEMPLSDERAAEAKQPVPGKSWKKLENQRPYKKVKPWLNAGHNVGLVLQRRLFILDFDTTEAYEALEPYMDDTFTVESQSRDGYHAYFELYNEDPLSQNTINTPEGPIDKKIPGKGFVLVPPSKVRNKYRVHQDEPIAKIDLDDVQKWLNLAFDKDEFLRTLGDDKVQSKPHSEKHSEPVEDDEITEVLDHIDTRPSYPKWMRVIAATLDACHGDKDRAERYLKDWSPEERNGEYRRKLNSLDNDYGDEPGQTPTTWATSLYYAQEDGDYEIPDRTIEVYRDEIKHVLDPDKPSGFHTGVYRCDECDEWLYEDRRSPENIPQSTEHVYIPESADVDESKPDWKLLKKLDEAEEHKAWLKVVKHPISEKAIELRQDSRLLKYIHESLDADHVLDHKEKMAAFITAVSSYLKESERHESVRLKGRSSTGKDNLMEAVFDRLPDEDSLFLTNATDAAIRDEAPKYKAIAFSEINMHREGGANEDLLEGVKQMAEGGRNDIKKDAENPNRTQNPGSEQKSIFYGTTDTDKDAEVSNRMFSLQIQGGPTKNKTVLDRFQDEISDLSSAGKQKMQAPWVKQLLRSLDTDHKVMFPYADVFKQPLETEDGDEIDFWDYTQARIKRDAKRIYHLAGAVTLLHQEIRPTATTAYDERILVSHHTDFIVAVKIFWEFFMKSFRGLDSPQLQTTLELIQQKSGNFDTQVENWGFDVEDGYIPRSQLQSDLEKSRNTIKDYVKELERMGYVETEYDRNVKQNVSLVHPINDPMSDLQLPIKPKAIDRCLQGGMREENLQVKQGLKIDYDDIEPLPYDSLFEHLDTPHISDKIDRSKIDRSKNPENPGGDRDDPGEADTVGIDEDPDISTSQTSPRQRVKEAIEELSDERDALDQTDKANVCDEADIDEDYFEKLVTEDIIRDKGGTHRFNDDAYTAHS